MIEIKVTKDKECICLWGDYHALTQLHEFVHNIVDNSQYITDKEGFLTALAYDIRKAYECQREMDSISNVYDEKISWPIYGVDILIPLFITQLAVIRGAFAYMPTSKLDHAILYELEYYLEEALKTAVPAEQVKEILYFMGTINSVPFDYLNDTVEHVCNEFIIHPKKTRLKELMSILIHLDPIWSMMKSMEEGTFEDLPNGKNVKARKVKKQDNKIVQLKQTKAKKTSKT